MRLSNDTKLDSKPSVFLIKLYFEPSFQIDLNIQDNPNMEHQLDYLEKVWNNTKSRLIDHQYYSNLLKDIEYTDVGVELGKEALAVGMCSYIAYRLIVPADLAVQTDIHGLTLALCEATKQYSDHIYLTAHTEGDCNNITGSVENVVLKH